jgi:hypothetical protein
MATAVEASMSVILYPMRLRIALVLVACAMLHGACTNPPGKEMNQARGAIEAARAAGADQYAPDEYKAAVASLKHSEDAVQQRDYRQALNDALDSREQAENAARVAANQKAAVRSQAERDLHDLRPLLDRAHARLKAAETSRTRRARTLQAERQTVAAADASVQKARTAMARQDYLAARDAILGVAEQLQATIRQIEAPAQASAPKHRR